MSRIGNNPINIPEGVKIDINDNIITVSGKSGIQKWSMHPSIKVKIDDDVMSFTYRKRPPRNIKIFNIEVENDKKYFYAEVKPPVEESYYILYNDGKRTILENYLVVDGEKIEIKMRLSKID